MRRLARLSNQRKINFKVRREFSTPTCGQRGDVDLDHPIDLEMLDVDLFRSKSLWTPVGGRAVFGGQVCGQALAASSRCVESEKELHSLHSYFLRGGVSNLPILYRVRKLNVTNNFEVHNISAKQGGSTIYSCQASYHRPEQSDLFHERAMPEAPPPDSLLSQLDILKNYLVDPRTPEVYKEYIRRSIATPFPIEMREVTPVDFFKPTKQPPRKLIWMRSRLPLAQSDSNAHRCLAAFASDWGLGSSSFLPHGITIASPQLKLATSLDHSMWFHAPFRADEWMLYDMHSVKLAGSRGMNIGYIYNANGELAITTTQEMLIRLKKKTTI